MYSVKKDIHRKHIKGYTGTGMLNISAFLRQLSSKIKLFPVLRSLKDLLRLITIFSVSSFFFIAGRIA